MFYQVCLIIPSIIVSIKWFSFFVGILSSIQAAFAVAEVGTLYPCVKALAVFFKAVGLFTVTTSFMG